MSLTMFVTKPFEIANSLPLAGEAAGAVEAGLAPKPMMTAAARPGRKTARARLTPRQMDVLALLCEGFSNKTICRRLNIAVGTVKVHIAGILRELGVSNRLQAVVAASRGDLADVLAGRAAATRRFCSEVETRGRRRQK